MLKKIIIASAFFLASANLSLADDSVAVEKFISELGNKIIKVADDKKLNINQKRDELIKIIDAVIDVDWVSKFVLGKHYRTANDVQKSDFKKLYREFMINTYSPQFTGYNGEKFTVTTVKNDGNYYTAKCILYPKNDAPTINLDFRVRKNSNPEIKAEFLVFDIVAEGVSLIETQRSEFGSVITKDGLNKFMTDLKIRNEKLKISGNKPAPKTATPKK